MLINSKDLVLEHQQRNGRRRIYAPQIHWAKWLYTGHEEGEALPAQGRKPNRQGTSDKRADNEADINNSKKEGLLGVDKKGYLEKGACLGVSDKINSTTPTVSQKPTLEKRKKPERVARSPWLRFRGRLADTLEWVQDSDDLLHSIKLTVAVCLVLWPSFVASWTQWFFLNRGRKFISI